MFEFLVELRLYSTTSKKSFDEILWRSTLSVIVNRWRRWWREQRCQSIYPIWLLFILCWSWWRDGSHRSGRVSNRVGLLILRIWHLINSC